MLREVRAGVPGGREKEREREGEREREIQYERLTAKERSIHVDQNYQHFPLQNKDTKEVQLIIP